MTTKASTPQLAYLPLSTFMIRLPLWPLKDYFGLSEITQETPLEVESLLYDQSRLEAILCVSPTLARAAQPATKPSTSSKELRQIRDSLERYFIRMSTRPTPFAAFAGIALGTVTAGGNTSVVLDRSYPPVPTARLDIQHLLSIVKSLEGLSEVRHQLHYYPNSALYESAGRLYMPVNDRYGQGTDDQIASVRLTPTLRAVMNIAKPTVSWQQLYGTLQKGAPQTPFETIVAYLDTLCQQGVLLSTLRPPLTLLNPLTWVLERLSDTSYRGELYQELTEIMEKLRLYNTQVLGEGINTLNTLYEKTGYSEGSRQATIEVDTGLQFVHAHLSSKVLEEAACAATKLLRLSTAPSTSQHLNDYRGEFIERYGEREIPILELLDEETGLGPPSSYHNPPPNRSRTPTIPPNYSRRDHILLRLAGEALYCHQREVEVDDALVSQLEVNSNWEQTAPDSLDLFVFVAAKNQQSIEAGDFLIVVGPRVGAYPAGRSFGRYCHVAPSKLTKWLRSRAEAEEARYPDTMFVDLVYSHVRGHATNVAIRPALYSYQIAINTTSSVDTHRTISLDDILVGVSGEHFYFRSRTHNKRIIFRSMHLLNFVGAPNVCRFLQEVSDDGLGKLMFFDWGKASQLPYLPRLRLGRTVLCTARWHLPSSVLADAGENWPRAFAAWRESWGVPRFVYFSQTDNRLLLDLDNPAHLNLLKTDLKKVRPPVQTITLEEALPGPDDAWVQDSRGNVYLSEFIFPFERDYAKASDKPNSESLTVLSSTNSNSLLSQRSFATSDRDKSLGDEWVFFKLYAGKERQDDVLLNLTKLLNEISHNVGLWFFVRYHDPLPHLRLRFFGDKKNLMRTVLEPVAIHLNILVKQKLLDKFTVDIYNRELEKYGGLEGMALSEKLFHADSEVVLKLVTRRAQKYIEFALDQIGVISVDYLVRGLGLDVVDRSALYQDLCQGQRYMLSINESQMSQDYRKVRSDLWSIFGIGNHDLRMLLTDFQSEVEHLAQPLKALDETGQLTRPFRSIIANNIHMHCNRLGLSRHEEFRVVYYLSRLYDGFRHYVPEAIHI